MKKTVAIIQARLGSTRLPLKMLLSLHGHAIIEWVVRRVKQSKLIDEVVVAIPITEDNNTLAKFLERFDVKIYRGSEGDVLDRFYQAAKKYNATHIVRVCADNPLIDGNEIDNLINFYLKEKPDYAYNNIPKDNLYPDGLGAEIISFDILKMMHKKADKQYLREHCMSYIVEQPEVFDIKTLNPIDKNLHYPNMKFDVDTFEDYEKLAMKFFDIGISSYDLIKLFTENKNEIS